MDTTKYHHHFFSPRIVIFKKNLDPLCTNNVDYMVATVNGGSIFGWANRHKVWRLKDYVMFYYRKNLVLSILKTLPKKKVSVKYIK